VAHIQPTRIGITETSSVRYERGNTNGLISLPILFIFLIKVLQPSPLGRKRPFHCLHDDGLDKENPSGSKSKRQRTHYNLSPRLAEPDVGGGLWVKEFYRHAEEMEKRIIENLEETRAILREIVSFIQK
jgi:hypothetical protein